MATSLKVASIAYLCDQHHKTVSKLEEKLSDMSEACFDAAKILANVTNADEINELISHISEAEETTVSSSAYSLLRCLQNMSSELKKVGSGLGEISSTIKVSQEVTDQELQQIRKLDEAVMEKVIKQKSSQTKKITTEDSRKNIRETLGAVRCWLVGIRQHELGRLHMLRTAFDSGAKVFFSSAARTMNDAKRLFKASNDIEPELDVDLSLHWAGTNAAKIRIEGAEEEEEKSGDDDDDDDDNLENDPLYSWFVDENKKSSEILTNEEEATSKEFYIGSSEEDEEEEISKEQKMPPPPPLPAPSLGGILKSKNRNIKINVSDQTDKICKKPRVINLRTRTRLPSPPATKVKRVTIKEEEKNEQDENKNGFKCLPGQGLVFAPEVVRTKSINFD